MTKAERQRMLQIIYGIGLAEAKRIDDAIAHDRIDELEPPHKR